MIGRIKLPGGRKATWKTSKLEMKRGETYVRRIETHVVGDTPVKLILLGIVLAQFKDSALDTYSYVLDANGMHWCYAK